MPELTFVCQTCGDKHSVQLTDEQAKPATRLIIACPSVDRRYRLTGFFVDTRRGFFDTPVAAKFAEDETQHLRRELGSENFDEKFARWKNIKYPPIGLIEEYPEKITEIINSYAMGYWYPSVTSACCLGERILNRLVLKCRDYFKGHPDYKKIYNKDSFDNWDRMLGLIEDWKLIPPQAIELFGQLAPIRNDTVHYNDGYDFKAVAETVVNKLIAAVTEVFGVMNRTDIYLVFDVPGEVWVRSTADKTPFVREFVLPHCYYAHAVHDIDANRRIVEKLGKVGPLTDVEFVELRKASTTSPPTAT